MDIEEIGYLTDGQHGAISGFAYHYRCFSTTLEIFFGFSLSVKSILSPAACSHKPPQAKNYDPDGYLG